MPVAKTLSFIFPYEASRLGKSVSINLKKERCLVDESNEMRRKTKSHFALVSPPIIGTDLWHELDEVVCSFIEDPKSHKFIKYWAGLMAENNARPTQMDIVPEEISDLMPNIVLTTDYLSGAILIRLAGSEVHKMFDTEVVDKSVRNLFGTQYIAFTDFLIERFGLCNVSINVCTTEIAGQDSFDWFVIATPLVALSGESVTMLSYIDRLPCTPEEMEHRAQTLASDIFQFVSANVLCDSKEVKAG